MDKFRYMAMWPSVLGRCVHLAQGADVAALRWAVRL